MPSCGDICRSERQSWSSLHGGHLSTVRARIRRRGKSMADPQNLTRKLLTDHLRAGDLVPGEDIDLAVDQILVEDATGSMTGLQFEALEAERVAVPLAVMYVDHNVLQIDDKNM